MNSSMHRTIGLIGVATLTLALLSCVGLVPWGGSGTTSVGGPRLDHSFHADMGVECTDCHDLGGPPGQVAQSMWDACMMCHEDLESEWPEEKRLSRTFFMVNEATGQVTARWTRASQPYPADYVFPHVRHGEKLDCTECHAAMLQGTARPQGQLLTMRQCQQCHTSKGAPGRCATCHRVAGDDQAPPSFAPEIVFPHVRHSQQVDCERCHGQMLGSEGFPGFSLTMEQCGTCHRQAGDPRLMDCGTCHRERHRDLPEATWIKRHHQVVRSDAEEAATCQNCHDPVADASLDPLWAPAPGCGDCHSRMDVKPSSHRHLWGERHGAMILAAGGVDPSCATCHTEPAFCESCHMDQMPRDHNNLFRTRTHGALAAVQRDRCQTCHQTDYCQRCHEDTPPRSHRGSWAVGRSRHCGLCHYPIVTQRGCSMCHRADPVHLTAPEQPATHLAGFVCRACHNATGGGGADPLRHVDPGGDCRFCHP